MKDEQNNKPASDQSQKFDRDLQIWYKLQSQETPSDELDNTIIKMATDAGTMSNRAAIDTRQYEAKVVSDNGVDSVVRVEKRFWHKNRWILSSAASVMLVVTLFMLNPQSPQEMLSDDAMPMMMQMSEPLNEQTQSQQADPIEGANFKITRSVMKNESLQAEIIEVASFEAKSSDIERTNVESTDVKSIDVKREPIQSVRALSQQILSTKPLSKVLPDQISSSEVVVSTKQALNHLQDLIDAKQWDEAEKLANKMAKQYPRLKELEHPQHKKWSELRAEIEKY
ncbi:MAG: hypothetical protein V5788_03300 [Shewanella sp.]